ncbi:hypothetical protein FGO68_gene11734 [Halteria grandinella]|uniref:Spt4/RpoE2 zinc finger domain-containing protein n=1 Tax=Halteria grandinella TaxID=5974 RepID=A0A8J8SZ14_HALGN|nr:hypothetical protein FGO68_gene11734 [Halteria grandinella]
MPKKTRKVGADGKLISEEQAEAEAEAQDEFKEEDLSDDEEARRRRRRRGPAVPEKPKLISTEFVPNSMKHLRACVFCKLVLNQEKWRRYETCPNCQDSRGLKDTTDQFESLISLVLPRQSWVAECQAMKTLIPGVYAMAVQQEHFDFTQRKGAGEAGEDYDDEDDEDDLDGFIVKDTRKAGFPRAK